MTLKEEFIDMLSLINPNITEDSYEEDYVIEEDCFMEVCKKTGKEITYSNECSECEYCLDDCNCEYKLCKKVDIYLWSGAEDSRGYIFKKDSDALNASSVHYINNQKQLVKEMAILKKEFDSFRDGYAAYAKRIQEYKKYIAEFVDEVTSEFSVFENVNKDIIPVVFDEDCRRDHDWEKETFIGGDFHNVGVQSVIHIYDSWSRDMEHMKQTIRHEILHYLLWCIAPLRKINEDDSGIFHYFCKIYDAHAYKEMDENNTKAFNMLQECSKEEVNVFLMKVLDQNTKMA